MILIVTPFLSGTPHQCLRVWAFEVGGPLVQHVSFVVEH